MGKHHWKVEKQPEWYVKAVRKTIAALPGGYAEAADWLDVTENALFNRLRADGDQIFPLGWAMVLQRAAGTHYIADAVAQSAGGVFVSLPEIEEVENADINQRLLEVIEQIGNYSKQIRSAIEDGVKEAYINAFNQMEKQLSKPPVPSDVAHNASVLYSYISSIHQVWLQQLYPMLAKAESPLAVSLYGGIP